MPAPSLTRKQVEQLADWLGTYIAYQPSHFYERAQPISPDHVNTLRLFFPKEILSGVRVTRGRASEPSFYSQLRALGIGNAPFFSDMAGITFQDVIVHVEPLTIPLLFHELVHAVQYKHLGLNGFAKRYVNGFRTGGSYEKIPLEKQAYGLEDRFARNPSMPLSVEEDVTE